MIKITISTMFIICSVASAQLMTETFGTGANQFSIDFVQIGNPGNSPDTTGRPNPTGSVAYTYNLGRYEVHRDAITKANVSGSLGIDMQDMNGYGGNGLNRPATGISPYEAAKFVNWLNSSKGYQVAYNLTVDYFNHPTIGVWSGGQYNGNNNLRHKDAYYFLPTEDEWYKAAFFDPNKPGGPGYWNYPTVSDSAPTPVSGGLLSGTAVYGKTIYSGPADVTNAGGLSAYGTMAQGGNVWELNESAYEYRGGAWNTSPAVPTELSVSARYETDPFSSNYSIGFRVASVPEPSALSLLAVGLGGLAMMRRRRS